LRANIALLIFLAVPGLDPVTIPGHLSRYGASMDGRVKAFHDESQAAARRS
jgi:hypothetical protein